MIEQALSIASPYSEENLSVDNHASIDACAKSPAVTEHHAKLDPFVGTFKARVKFWMGPGEPQISTGTMENTWDLGGRFIKQVYTGDATEGPFLHLEGRGYWGYNTTTGKYEGFWIDSGSTVMQAEVGTLDETGKLWTMVGSNLIDPYSGKPMIKRNIIMLIDEGSHTAETFFVPPDGRETKSMEVTYIRAPKAR